MAKPITISDLHAALKPIIEAINKLREETSSYTSEISEIHNMTTSISVKIDTLEQTAGATLSEVSKPVVKKATGRKPATVRKPVVKKAPTKRGGKPMDAPQADLDDQQADPDMDNLDDTQADADDAVEPDLDDDADNLDEEADNVEAEEAEQSDDSSKKVAPKKVSVVVKKPAPKKTSVKAPVKAPLQRLNKMTLFKDIFKSNPAKFDKYLTAKVKKSIDAENEKFKELSGESLATAQRSAYYTYMRTHHDDVLESLKTQSDSTQDE
jgi:hypothetical protein